MRRHRKLAIASVACLAAALALTPAAVAKPKKTKFEKIGHTAADARSVFGPRAELTTRPFNPGPNAKLRIEVVGAVSSDPLGYGSQALVSGTLTCKKGGQELSASESIQTYFPFETTYKTSVTGIKNPKRCTLHVLSAWDPVPASDGFPHYPPAWPQGPILIDVYLKK